MTVREYMKAWEDLVNEHPRILDLPVIYAIDDEGNDFQHAINTPSLVQVHDPDEFYVEIVGFYDPKSDEIALEDINCVCMN